MGVFLVLAFIAVFNFAMGVTTGYSLSSEKRRRKIYLDEKEIYCNGFEDGIYYAVDQYCPELYRPEIAEMRYKEYKAIKHGPEKH